MTDRRKSRPPAGLGEDDIAVWQIVAERIGPAKGKPRVPDIDLDLSRAASRFEPVSRASLSRAVAKPGEAKGIRHGPATSQPKPATQPPPEPKAVVLERRKARRIARGAEGIEARLDLHGMTQDDAHRALSGFIRRCHAEGLRTVLVITGKGGSARTKADDTYDPWERPRGVLKRNVPVWLGQPGLAPLVVSWSTAHVRHGGEGALYVQIRVKR